MKKNELPKSKTSAELRRLIIWAKYEIDQFEDFIKLCEKRIQKNKKI